MTRFFERHERRKYYWHPIINESLGISAKLFKRFNLLNARGKAFPDVQQWVLVEKS